MGSKVGGPYSQGNNHRGVLLPAVSIIDNLSEAISRLKRFGSFMHQTDHAASTHLLGECPYEDLLAGMERDIVCC
jgi:hypothetical protein